MEISDLNAHVIKLRSVIESHEEQIRILQFALDQRVRTALAGNGPADFEISGPATLEPWSGMPPPGGWLTPGDGRSETSSQAGMDSDMSDRASDAGTECDYRDSSSEFGSFSDVSAPSQDPFDDPSELGTPRIGSPAPTVSPPATPSSGGDWSEIDADSEEDLDYMSPSPPTNPSALPPSPTSSVSAVTSSGLRASIVMPSSLELRNSKESQWPLGLFSLKKPIEAASASSCSLIDPARPEELRSRLFPADVEDKTAAIDRLAQLAEDFSSFEEFEVDITDSQQLRGHSPTDAQAPATGMAL